MQVLWSGHDRAQWDAWHRTAAAALQQDWAYGEAMQSGGVRCLRARVLADGRTLASASSTTSGVSVAKGCNGEASGIECMHSFSPVGCAQVMPYF